jgi:hypothetical protein
MMTYKTKYLPQVVYKDRPRWMNGCKPKPENWDTEERIIERDIYYALLKHRAQAKFRNQEHTLTESEWRDLWTVDRWLCRGRCKTDLCLMLVDREGGWHKDNVAIVERRVYLERAGEYRNNNNDGS